MIVMSLKGHDTGRLYLVIGVEGKFAWLADGNLRSVDRTKKKRCSHIKPLGQAVEPGLIERMHEMRQEEADIEIRKTISSFLSMNEKEG